MFYVWELLSVNWQWCKQLITFTKAISKPLPIVKVLIKPLLFLYFSFIFSKEELQSSYIYNYINMIIQREALST